MIGRRVIAAGLAWLLLVVAPTTWVVSQQGVDQEEETEILLDTIVLELEGPTAGEVEAGLSLDIQILEPERWPPLPEPGGLDDIDLVSAISAPAIEHVPLGSAPGRTLVAEAYLSAGTLPAGGTSLPLAHFASGVSVLGTGANADFSLVFDHSSRDGVRAYKGAGEGAKSQRHELAGSLRLPVAGGELDTEAGVVTTEQGFQGVKRDGGESTSFNSMESQQVTGAVSYATLLSDSARLTTAIDVRAEAATLTGSGAKTHTELWAAPELLLDWDALPDLGLELQFSARYLVRRYSSKEAISEEPAEKPGEKPAVRHLFGVAAGGHLDIGGVTGLELSLGWSWSPGETESQFQHQLPFQAVVSGTPFSWLSFRVAGGREIREHGLGSLAARSPYIQPPDEPVSDDVGWFASVRGQLGLGELLDLGDLTLVATTHLATYKRPLHPSKQPNEEALYDLASASAADRISIRPGLGVEVGAGESVRMRLDVSKEVAPEGRQLNYAPDWRAVLGGGGTYRGRRVGRTSSMG